MLQRQVTGDDGDLPRHVITVVPRQAVCMRRLRHYPGPGWVFPFAQTKQMSTLIVIQVGARYAGREVIAHCGELPRILV